MKIGDIVQKIAIARWSRTFSALTSAGVPLIEALDITGKSAGNEVINSVMLDVIDSVKRGGSIADPLKQSTVFPLMVSQMVAVGNPPVSSTTCSRTRRLLRGPRCGRRQGAHVDHRAGDDHLHRRHGRVHRHRDVPAAVQGLPAGSIARPRSPLGDLRALRTRSGAGRPRSPFGRLRARRTRSECGASSTMRASSLAFGRLRARRTRSGCGASSTVRGVRSPFGRPWGLGRGTFGFAASLPGFGRLGC